MTLLEAVQGGQVPMQIFDPLALQRELAAQRLSLAELARALNVRVTNVSGWVNGRHRPSIGNIERISQVLQISPDALMKEVTDYTPGPQGAVGLSRAQALILAVAVALVNAPDGNTMTEDWLNRLKPAEQQNLTQRLIISPQWAWAWEKLHRLGFPDHPLSPYTIQVRITPPPSQRRSSS